MIQGKAFGLLYKERNRFSMNNSIKKNAPFQRNDNNFKRIFNLLTDFSLYLIVHSWFSNVFVNWFIYMSEEKNRCFLNDLFDFAFRCRLFLLFGRFFVHYFCRMCDCNRHQKYTNQKSKKIVFINIIHRCRISLISVAWWRYFSFHESARTFVYFDLHFLSLLESNLFFCRFQSELPNFPL